MIWGYILIGLLISLIASALLRLYFKTRIEWNRYWALFMMVAMAAWIGSLWVIPLGFGYWTVYLLLFMGISIVFGFMISIASQNNPNQSIMTQEEAGGPEATRRAVGISVGILLALLLVIVGSRYLYEFTI